jgi:hypothetical protein
VRYVEQWGPGRWAGVGVLVGDPEGDRASVPAVAAYPLDDQLYFVDGQAGHPLLDVRSGPRTQVAQPDDPVRRSQPAPDLQTWMAHEP